MAGSAPATIPCPECPESAFSQAALDDHVAHAHPIAGTGGGPTVASAPVATSLEPVPVTQAEPDRPVAVDAMANPVLRVPEADDTFWVDDRVTRLIHTVGMISADGEIVNVLLTGPKGTGKTSLPSEFAAAMGRPFLNVHCALVAERDDWWGSKELSLEKGTHFEQAAFLDALETPGCVICLDEANRTHPENLNALFGLLDHRRNAWVPQVKREVVVAKGVTFWVTLNEGYEYVGTNPIDEALRDRMSYTIRMRYPPKAVEKGILVARIGVSDDVADRLAELARSVRKNPKLQLPISPRSLLAAATLVKRGMPIQEAVLFGMVNGLPEDVDKQSLLQALQIIGKVGDAYVDPPDPDDIPGAPAGP
jgi:nitric oxide reductase NorQ protein